jgi:hypothetical protein
MATKLVCVDRDGNEVQPGTELRSFRGDKYVLVGATRENQPGKDGTVAVRVEKDGWEAAYYANVFGLRVLAERL